MCPEADFVRFPDHLVLHSHSVPPPRSAVARAEGEGQRAAESGGDGVSGDDEERVEDEVEVDDVVREGLENEGMPMGPGSPL